MPFTSELSGKPTGGDGFTLTRKLTYESDASERVAVPRWFTYDGSSVPRLLRSLFPSKLSTLRSAAVHDKLYRDGWLEVRRGAGWVRKPCSRRRADQIYREGLLAERLWRSPATKKREYVSSDCSRYDAAKAYLGLRLGGWLAWRRHRRRAIAERQREE